MIAGASTKMIAYVIAPENFRDEEYFQPKVILQSHGYTVNTAAKGDPDEVTGTKGGKARTDTHFGDINPTAYDALVFSGGAGAQAYLHDQDIMALVKQFYTHGKVVAAICIAPSILANAGILQGRQATAFSDQENNLKNNGAIWQMQPVVSDGQIITANGPEAAIAFGETIAQVLNHG